MSVDYKELALVLSEILSQSKKEDETLSQCLMRQEWHKYVPNSVNICICEDHQILDCMPLTIIPGRYLTEEELKVFSNQHRFLLGRYQRGDKK